MVRTDNCFFYIIKLGKLNYVFKGPKGNGKLTHVMVCINEVSKEHVLEKLSFLTDSNNGEEIKKAIEEVGRKPSFFGGYSDAKTAICQTFGSGALILDRLNLNS